MLLSQQLLSPLSSARSPLSVARSPLGAINNNASSVNRATPTSKMGKPELKQHTPKRASRLSIKPCSDESSADIRNPATPVVKQFEPTTVQAGQPTQEVHDAVQKVDVIPSEVNQAAKTDGSVEQENWTEKEWASWNVSENDSQKQWTEEEWASWNDIQGWQSDWNEDVCWEVDVCEHKVSVFGESGVLQEARGYTPRANKTEGRTGPASVSVFGESGVLQEARGYTPRAHKAEGRTGPASKEGEGGAMANLYPQPQPVEEKVARARPQLMPRALLMRNPANATRGKSGVLIEEAVAHVSKVDDVDSDEAEICEILRSTESEPRCASDILPLNEVPPLNHRQSAPSRSAF